MDAMAKGVLCFNGTWARLLNHVTVTLQDIFLFFYKGKQLVSSSFGAEWGKVCSSDSVYKLLKMVECSL